MESIVLNNYVNIVSKKVVAELNSKSKHEQTAARVASNKSSKDLNSCKSHQ